MTTPRTKFAAVVSAAGVLAIVAAAAFVWHHLPTPTDLYGPFEVRGEVGERVQGRAVAATVTGVRVAPHVNSVKAAGVWVVVDTSLEATRATELPHADLLVGPNVYAPSDRFFGDTLMAEIAPGITQRGSWVFDVAPTVLEGHPAGPLLLRVWAGSEMLDSRLVIEISADDTRVTRTDNVTLASPELSAE